MTKLKSHKSFKGFTEFYEHDSQLTQTKMKFSVYRPPEGTPICGGLIWLSGLTCTDENFITKAGAQAELAKSGLCIICPDTSPRGLDLPAEHDSYDFGSGAGFYVDATTDSYNEHYKMFSYINEEIYDLFNEMFQLQGNVSIFGHSMGGHGALISGLRFPEKYKSISAFSPIVNPIECAWGKKALKGYLGEDSSTWSNYDTCELLKSGKTHPAEILIDQGLNDEFYPDQLRTENFVNIAHECGQKNQVNMREGYDHSYYFIASFIHEHIQHHLKYLTVN